MLGTVEMWALLHYPQENTQKKKKKGTVKMLAYIVQMHYDVTSILEVG